MLKPHGRGYRSCRSGYGPVEPRRRRCPELGRIGAIGGVGVLAHPRHRRSARRRNIPASEECSAGCAKPAITAQFSTGVDSCGAASSVAAMCAQEKASAPGGDQDPGLRSPPLLTCRSKTRFACAGDTVLTHDADEGRKLSRGNETILSKGGAVTNLGAVQASGTDGIICRSMDVLPEETGGRYGRHWRPPDLKTAMRAIVSDDAELFESSGREISDVITSLIPSPEAVVVDLGCGIGRVAKHVASQCGLLWAVDVSVEMLEFATQWLEGVPNIRFSLGEDGGVPDVPDESVDLVYAVFVLQHLEREDAFVLLRDVRRMLRPEGRAYLTFPNLLSEVYLRSFVAYAESGEAARNHIRARMYTPTEVRQLVTAAGLAVVEIDDGNEITVLAVRDRREDHEPDSTARGSQTKALHRGGIDALPAGTLCRQGPLQLTGWAVLEDDPIDRVEIAVEGHPEAIRARLGLVRHDALAATGLAPRPGGGFRGLD